MYLVTSLHCKTGPHTVMSESELTHICDSIHRSLPEALLEALLLTVANWWIQSSKPCCYWPDGIMWPGLLRLLWLCELAVLWHQQQLRSAYYKHTLAYCLFIPRVGYVEYYYWAIKSVRSCMTDVAHGVERATAASQPKKHQKNRELHDAVVPPRLWIMKQDFPS